MSGKPKPAGAHRLAFCLYAISKEGKDVRHTPDRDDQGGIIMKNWKKAVSLTAAAAMVMATAAVKPSTFFQFFIIKLLLNIYYAYI